MRNVRLAVGFLSVVGCARVSEEIRPADPDVLPVSPADGGVAKPLRLDTLIVAETPPPALSGGTLAVAKDGSIAVAADPDRDVVYLIDPAAGDVRKVTLAKGSEPGRVVLDGARAHVALRGRGSVLAIDLATATVGAETPVCALPRGVAFDAARDAVVIACADGQLVTLAASNHTPLASTQLDVDLRDVLVRADGSLQVSRYRSAELLHVQGGEVKGKSTPLALRQPRFNFGKDGFGKGGDAPQPFFPDGGISSVVMSPTLAWKTVASGDAGTMMLHQESQDDEVVIAEGGGYGGGCETITQASLTHYDGEGQPTNTITLAPHGLVVDVALSPDGRFAALAEPGGYLQQRATVEVLPIEGIEMPVATDGGVLSFDTPRFPTDAGVFVSSSCASGQGAAEDGQVTSVAYDDDGVLYALSREPARLYVYELRPQNEFSYQAWPNLSLRARIALASDSVRDTGHELFHADVGSGLSCAGCHGEALDDGHVWNFQDFGPRRTQTMRGGLLSTFPLHWEGDLPTFKHLVDEVMTRRMGGFAVEQQYSEALGAWLDKLPPMKLGVSADSAVQRGKVLFESAEVACATCHNGPHLTNNQSFDVGTGELLQVPTLLGIALHPPFMHDGCAATLEARFEPSCGGGDRHGHTSQLTDAEIADLVSYLKTL